MYAPNRLRLPLAGIALCALALVISACGGSSAADKTDSTSTSSSAVPANAVAVVGSETVTRAELTALLTQNCQQYKAAKKACPKAGTSAYKKLQTSFIAQLVTQKEFDAAGKQLGVTVKQNEITTNLTKLKLQYAKGTDGKVDDTKWQKVLKDNSTTQAAVVDNLRNGLLRQAIYVNLTKSVTVPDSAVTAYYTKNKKSYAKPASREIRHILVKDKALADKIYGELRSSDAQFAALAKKYTIDPGSKKNGGKLGAITQGQTVPTFDKVAFSIATGKVAPPVKSSYGWHVIEATGDIVKATQEPLNAALKSKIRTNLLTTKKQSVANKWFMAFQKKIEKNVRYAAGMTPPKTTSTATTPATSATTAQ